MDTGCTDISTMSRRMRNDSKVPKQQQHIQTAQSHLSNQSTTIS